MKQFKSKCGKHDIIVDDEDYQRVIDFAPNGWEIKFTTGSNYPYAVTRKTVDGKRKHFYLHRLILNIWKTNTPHVDHIKQGDKLDNRKENLRLVTRSQNMSNRTSKKNSVSAYLGVTFCGYKKSRQYRVDLQRKDLNSGKKIFMGYYDSDIQAGYAYNCAANIIHGEYANPNNINPNEVNDLNHINDCVMSRLEKLIQTYQL